MRFTVGIKGVIKSILKSLHPKNPNSDRGGFTLTNSTKYLIRKNQET